MFKVGDKIRITQEYAAAHPGPYAIRRDCVGEVIKPFASSKHAHTGQISYDYSQTYVKYENYGWFTIKNDCIELATLPA